MQAFTFLREFVLGNNKAGLVTKGPNGAAVVIGGENPALEGIIQGGDEIYIGAGATQTTYIAPAATRAAWKAFIKESEATTTRPGHHSESQPTKLAQPPSPPNRLTYTRPYRGQFRDSWKYL